MVDMVKTQGERITRAASDVTRFGSPDSGSLRKSQTRVSLPRTACYSCFLLRYVYREELELGFPFVELE
jgi:hypothetical protein